MARFAVSVEECRESRDFFAKTSQRLKSREILRNPFLGGVKRVQRGVFVVEMTALYPNFAIWGLGMIVASLVFFGVGWTQIPGIMVSLTGLPRSSWVLYAGLVRGLRREGYQGKVAYLRKNEVLRRWMHGPDRSV